MTRPSEAGGAVTAIADLDARDPAWDPVLEDLLRGVGVGAAYQPIVDLRRLTVVGYEALARFPQLPGCTPDRVFNAAAARGSIAALEALTLRAALSRRADLPANCFLAVNVEPESLTATEVAAVFREQGSLGGLVIEVTEHRPLQRSDNIEGALAQLKGAGALLAVDDAGAGYAGLQQILELRPSILKLDRALVTDVDADEAKAALVEMLGVFGGRIDAWLLAEGVERIGEAQRLIDLGVPLAQGYLFARPAAPWATIEPYVHAELRDRTQASSATTLHRLVDPVDWVYENDLDDAVAQLGRTDAALVVVLDSHRRPQGLLTVASAMQRELVKSLVVNVDTSPADLAHRVATRRPCDTSHPVLVIDSAGRYLGVVAIARLLASLAATHNSL